MKFKDGGKELYDTGFANQQGDPYGERCFTYAKEWAELMEAQMLTGAKLADVAQATSHEADTDGITGFMYGMAVKIRAATWEHGDVLALWHNRQYLPDEQALKAAEAGRVVNPALLTIGTPSDDPNETAADAD